MVYLEYFPLERISFTLSLFSHMEKKSPNKMTAVYLFIYLHFKAQIRIYLLQKAIRESCVLVGCHIRKRCLPAAFHHCLLAEWYLLVLDGRSKFVFG